MSEKTDVVEAVARAIDPERTAYWDDYTSLYPEQTAHTFASFCNVPYAKARAAILALAENLSEEMVEAGARALYLAQFARRHQNGFDAMPEREREEYRQSARAAIQAALKAAVEG